MRRQACEMGGGGGVCDELHHHNPARLGVRCAAQCSENNNVGAKLLGAALLLLGLARCSVTVQLALIASLLVFACRPGRR